MNNEKKILISVIIPVCNVESYVEQCVRSVMRQSLRELEIICINDGSEDHSLEILRKLEREDGRIRVIDKENAGYGHTINTGLRIAKGKYIGIVESDDYAEADMYQKLYEAAERYAADVVKANFYEVYEEESGRRRVLNEYLEAVPYDCLVSSREQLLVLGPTIWAGIYRREFLLANDIWLLETKGASYQDTSFAFKVMYAAERVTFLKEAFINYRCDNFQSSVHAKAKTFYICNEMQEEKRFMLTRGGEDDLPILSRVKYLRYRWNLDRLNGIEKLKFLLLMHEEFKQDDLAGLLVRSKWAEDEWIYIHRLIYDLDGFVRETLLDKEIVSQFRQGEEEILQMVFRMSRDISIYGAGKCASILLSRLQSLNIPVKRFIVSDMIGNPEWLEGIPVVGIEQADGMEEDMILLGVSGKLQGEIIHFLRSRNLNNFMIWEN